MNIINKEIKINCIDCAIDYKLVYHSDTNSHFCRFINSAETCVVKYCKTCKEYNNYFCKECLDPNYEISPITGACVKKVPKIPAITWKDLFRFQLNQKKIINGKEIYGPTLMLLGLTRNEIPQFHALLTYLTFKVKYSDNLRNLEEEIKIPTICEIVESVDEAVDEINKVEYECIGDISEYENEEMNFTLNELVNLEENPNDNVKVLRNSNLNEVIKEKNIKKLLNKTSTTFTLKNFVDTSLFIFDEIKNQTSDNLIFNFSLNGKLNNELYPSKIYVDLSIAEIKDKYANCTFEIKENKEANLNCYLNIEDYKDYKTLSFKTTTIDYDEKSIFIDSIHEIF